MEIDRKNGIYCQNQTNDRIKVRVFGRFLAEKSVFFREKLRKIRRKTGENHKK